MQKVKENYKLQIEHKRIADLRPYENNARTHSSAQIDQIARSITEFSWTNPVLVAGDGTIIAGHARLLAAKKLGMDSVPTIVLDHLTESQRKALVLADNKLALNAGWDEDLLAAELKALEAEEFDLSLLGFDDAELAELMNETTAGLTDEDEAPEVAEPISQAGDLWICGKHRIYCGDSTKAEDVGILLGGVVPGLMVTDPPYGVEYDASWRNKALRADGTKIGARAIGKVSNDDRADWRETWSLFGGDVAYVWHGMLTSGVVVGDLESTGFKIRAEIVWAKSNFCIGRGDYHAQHESCWYAVRKGKTGHWAGDRSQATLWKIDKPMKSETGHSTQKPVECMRRPILNNSSPGQAVYDPFLGSGTTIIAAETENRVCYGIELNPVYVDVCVKRWQDFTGNLAALESTGETFDSVSSSKTAK